MIVEKEYIVWKTLRNFQNYTYFLPGKHIEQDAFLINEFECVENI